MIVELASVGVLPKKLKISLPSGDIDLDGEGEIASDVVFDGQAIEEKGKVRISGRLLAQVRQSCTRCLEASTKSLQIDVNAVFIDSANEDLNFEKEITGEELDESIVIGGEIDLKEVVREQILLALPDQVYCRADCKGLCPKCGENLNLIDCTCSEGDIDPRWAVLKNLR